MRWSASEYLSAKLGKRRPLSDFKKLMQVLQNPHLDYRVIHVAGTNGKGSTCAMLDSILRESKLKTGLYTSPALVRVNERMRINGQEIDDESLTKAAWIVYQAEQTVGIRYSGFDRMTATAFQLFSMFKVDIVVLETGVGGRLDATNVCRSEAAILTAIDLDHTAYLGETIEEIAREKCEIIKPGQICVVSHPQTLEAQTVIRETCKARNVQLFEVNDCDIQSDILPDLSRKVRIRYTKECSLSFFLPLLGDYQAQNACAVLLLCHVLCVNILSVQEGFSKVQWSGRMELLKLHPPVLLDGAHNPHAMQTLTGQIRKYFADYEIVLIVAMMADKNCDEMVALLSQVVSKVYTVEISDRALEAEKLAQLFSIRKMQAIACENTQDALIAAFEGCRNAQSKKLVLITGSIYLVGACREVLISTKNE